MATAYKYVERKAEDNINWAEVGSNLTNTLKEENRVREEKKGAIDAATREMQKVLNNIPQGENTQLNEFALNAGADLQEVMLMQETLLKSGQLDPRQYTITRQNLVDGTDQAFSLFENYNAEYKRKMAMNNSNLPVGEQASEIQNWSMGLVEGFGNFQDSKLIINPQTGIMSMAKMIPDPNNPNGPRIPDENNLMTVQNLENRIKGTYTKYDVIGTVDEYAKSLGVDKEVQRKMGGYRANGLVTEVSDITKREGFGSLADLTDAQIAVIAKKAGIKPEDVKVMSMYEKAEDSFVKSQLGIGDNSAASVLVDFLQGDGYTPTMDPKEAAADPLKVLMVNNNGKLEAELTDEQQAKAEEAMKVQLRMQLDKTEEYKAAPKDYNAPTYAPKDVRDDKREDKAKENIQRTWNSIKGQTADERVASFESLIGTAEGKAAGLIGVNPSTDGLSIEFVYTDTVKNRRIDFTEDISDEDWAILGNEITGLDDPTKALNAGGFIKDADGNSKPLNTDFGESGANRQGNQGRFDTEVSSFIKKGFPKVTGSMGTEEPFLDQSDKKVAKALNDRYSKYGLKAVATGIGTTDNTRVTIDGWKGNAEYPAEFDLDSDINIDSNALEEEQRFEKWLTYVLKQTKQIETLARDQKFTGGQGKYGPCVNGKKEELATGLQVNC